MNRLLLITFLMAMLLFTGCSKEVPQAQSEEKEQTVRQEETSESMTQEKSVNEVVSFNLHSAVWSLDHLMRAAIWIF